MMPLAPDATIGTVLEDDPELSTFNNLIRHSGFIRQLDGPGEYTVLAPTNAAFEQLPPGTMHRLMDDAALMHRVMSYHVVPGQYAAEGIAERTSLPTMYGRDVSVVVADEGMVVGGASLEETDTMATNGFVHKIAQVMWPE